ncbi:MAG: hypothetical protein NC191_02595 [Muribaculaceae bacterium]|nr:hypothetical protein [Muribaculaceae bacterium]
MRDSQIKEIKAFYSSKLRKNTLPAGNDGGKTPNEPVSKPFFNSVMAKLKTPPQR